MLEDMYDISPTTGGQVNSFREDLAIYWQLTKNSIISVMFNYLKTKEKECTNEFLCFVLFLNVREDLMTYHEYLKYLHIFTEILVEESKNFPENRKSIRN